ncbi:MAG: SMP-30/gluconolactonase/LRE family protein, partial [Sphingomonadaceae bacterium]
MSGEHPVCVWDVAAELGEGPLWSPADQMLWFVDIKQDRLHRLDTRTGEGRSWATPAAPGFVARSERGGLIVGAKSGLHRFDPDAGTFTPFAEVEAERPGNRLNDGAVDPSGRLWFGSMDDAEAAPSGRLYRMEPGGPVALDDGYVITNGPAFSPDGRVLYHTDTLERTIYAFDLAADGAIAGKRVFVEIEPGAGYPDGPVVDAEGCLWTGLFGGWGVRRYSSAGELLETVAFPCANVTKLAFGGEGLRTAYATTAWKGL